MTDDLGNRRAVIASEARRGQIHQAAQTALHAALERAPGATRVLVVVEYETETGIERGLAGWPVDMGTEGMGTALCAAGLALIDGTAKEVT